MQKLTVSWRKPRDFISFCVPEIWIVPVQIEITAELDLNLATVYFTIRRSRM